MVNWPGDAPFEPATNTPHRERRCLQPFSNLDQRAYRHPYGRTAPFPGRREGHGDHADRSDDRPRASDRDSASRINSKCRSWNPIISKKASACFSRPKTPQHHWKTHTFQEKFVHIPESTAHYLAKCAVQTVGVDYLSVGGYETDSAETHRALLAAGIWLIEGLNLEHVEPGEYELICLPLKIVGSDGAPARAVLRRTEQPNN